MRHDHFDVASLLRYIKDGELLIQPSHAEATKKTFVVSPGASTLGCAGFGQDQRPGSLTQNKMAISTLDPLLRTQSTMNPPSSDQSSQIKASGC